MKTMTVSVGGLDWVIGYLTYGQVQSIMDGNVAMLELFQSDERQGGEKAVELRNRTVIWSLNNAAKWPDRQNQFGSETEPLNITSVISMMPFPVWGECLNELHMEILKFNKLMVKPAGESQAATEAQLTGASSVAA